MAQINGVSVQVSDNDIALLLPHGVYRIKRMESRTTFFKRTIIFLICLLAVALIGLGYYYPNKDYSFAAGGKFMPLSAGHNKHIIAPFKGRKELSYDMLKGDFSFDMDSHDVMVFLHMQKTGGTSFGRHLVHDLDLKRPCTCPVTRKRCYCFRPHSNQSWLFSRYTTGWQCGLHADWTELTSCVDGKLDEIEGKTVKRRYFYITLLREPIARYLSEFRHVQRGATWKNSRHFCHRRTATAQELPPCYEGEDWEDVELDEFMDCKSNLAVNRQTRMLADLALVNCYNRSAMPASDRDHIMLASAKRNLEAMAFFGLTEYQKISQYIFEETFNLRFSVPFEQNNITVSGSTVPTLTDQQMTRIADLNHLDLQLYEFAKDLLMKRFEAMKSRDLDFEHRWKYLGQLSSRSSVAANNYDWGRLELNDNEADNFIVPFELLEKH